MSKPKPTTLAEQAKITVLGRDPDPPPEVNIADLIARFQLETEQKIGDLRREYVRALEGTEKRVAALGDEWTAAREQLKALERRVETAVHEMTQAVREAINAQRESVAAAQRASDSAAVFEKLRASQPDLHRMVRDQDKVVAGVRDALAHMDEKLNGLSKKLDEFEVVADDYEETKGAVRGLDIVVKDLNNEARQRRQVSGRGS